MNNPDQTLSNGSQVKMHEGEIPIDAALVKRLLTEQFPTLAQLPITLIRSTGTVNAIFRLGEEFCVRLPRSAAWAGSIDHEWIWLPKLAPHLSLRIPKPFAKGDPVSWYPCPWAVYHWIPGSTYHDSLLIDERQAVNDLVHFILELRKIEIPGAPLGGRPPLTELATETFDAIESSRGVIDREAATAAWARSLASAPWDGNPVWIHGDLLVSNLLVQNGRLCAVIDFGGAGIGDPAADVVPAWSVFSSVGRGIFRESLEVDDQTWTRARGYALHQALMIIPYYPETNPEFVRMAKRTVSEVLGDFQ